MGYHADSLTARNSMTMSAITPPFSEEMYGCDIDEFIASAEASLPFILVGPGLIVVSLLSDGQELFRAGQYDAAIQHINRAKYLICHYRMGFPLAVMPAP
jgi:hypothetical protein